jgi:hypothetical protein
LSSSLKSIRINIQRPPFLYRKIVKSYWPFMISLPNIGRVYEPVIRLNPPLVLSGTEPKDQKAVSIVMVCCTWCLSWDNVQRRNGEDYEDFITSQR